MTQRNTTIRPLTDTEIDAVGGGFSVLVPAVTRALQRYAPAAGDLADAARGYFFDGALGDRVTIHPEPLVKPLPKRMPDGREEPLPGRSIPLPDEHLPF